MTNLSTPDQPPTSGGTAPALPTDLAECSSIALTATPSTNTVAVSWTSVSAGQQTYAGPVDLMPDGIRQALAQMMGLSSSASPDHDPPAYHTHASDPTAHTPKDTKSAATNAAAAPTSTAGGNTNTNVRRHQFGPVRIELPGEFGPEEQAATERALEQAAEGIVQAATTVGQYVSRSVGSVVDARVSLSPPPPPPPPTSSWFGSSSSSTSSSSSRQLGLHVVIENGGTRHEFNSFGSLARYVVQALLSGGPPRTSSSTNATQASHVVEINENVDHTTQSNHGGKKAMSEIGEDLD